MVLILVASATALTAGHALTELSTVENVKIRAMVRKLDDERAAKFSKLDNVELVEGDFDDPSSIEKILYGVDRVLLVSGAFAYEQFERETTFMEIAVKAGVEAIVRISTASMLIGPGTKGAYGRAHHGIEAFARINKVPCVNLNPNYFLSNLLGSAEEAKASGRISLPLVGDKKSAAMIDPRDVGHAAAMILQLPSDYLSLFVAAEKIEVHGPEVISFNDVMDALSKATGKTISINTIPDEVFVDTLVGFGVKRVFAASFLDTYKMCSGAVPPTNPGVSTSSPLLYSIGWKPQHDVNQWAESVASLFTK